MATNIKVAIATGDAVLKYVEDDTTVGSNGTADSNIPSTTRIMAIHAVASAAGSFLLKVSDRLQTRLLKVRLLSFR